MPAFGDLFEAGLDGPSAGASIPAECEIVGRSVESAVLFQSHALAPRMTALGNIAFAITSQWPRAQVLRRSQRHIDVVYLTGAEDKKPAPVSRGMKQRARIARALAIKPQILSMDEPVGAFDALILERPPDPAGDRVKVTMTGKFLKYKKY